MKKNNLIIISGVLTACLLLAIILAALSVKNVIVYEADFESGMGGFVKGGNAVLEYADEQAISGKNSLKVYGGNLDWHGARIPGAKTGMSLSGEYEFSAMAYSETEMELVMQITLIKKDGFKDYIWLENMILKQGKWTEYFATLSLSSGQYTAIESISFENKTEPFSAPYYLDNVKITKIEKITPLIIVMIAILAIITLISFVPLLSDLLSGKRIDALTGVYSRDIIEKNLPSIINKAAYRKDICLIMADLDHFKSVNDTYGHAAGDVVLKNFAKIIQQCIRSNKDWVSRYGGEEFLIFLSDTNGEVGRAIAEQIRKKLEESSVTVDGKTISVTASFGTASLLESDLKTAQDLIKFADQNLYAAKKSGRNKVC